jgi:hypothetical protein
MLDKELSKYGSSIDVLETVISKHRREDLSRLDNRITCALEYYGLLMEGLETEEYVAFVAMPFSTQFLEYFRKFYRHALRDCGYSCVRSFGGLGYENYSEYMRNLIKKCGKMFADVSGQNGNVMYEVGFAHGQGKHVYLVTNDRDYPANLCDDVVVFYDPSVPDWEDSAAGDFQMWFLAEQVGLGMKDQFETKLKNTTDKK